MYCKMITTTALANICIISHNYHFIFVVRTFKIYSLSKFQVCDTVLLTTITMPYIRISEHFILYLKVYTLWPISPLFPHLQLLVATISDSVSMSLAFLDSTYKWYHIVFVFLCLISLSKMPSRSIHVVPNDRMSCFSMAEYFIVCVCVSVCITSALSIHLSYTKWDCYMTVLF